MAVQFILGEHPREKRKQMIHHMHTFLKENQNDRMIYLVPDNVKFEAETTLLKEIMESDASKYSGMMRLQVFSFSRLAWYLLQNKPIYQRQQLTETGLAMLVKNIIKAEEENLTIFRGASQQTGFISRLVTLFMELRNGKVTPTDLFNIVESSEAVQDIKRKDFSQKMHDISLLYQKYDEQVANKYLESEDLYSELISFVKSQQSLFKNVTIVVDHYEHFSAQEQELLMVLAKQTKKVMICLTLDAEMVRIENNLSNPYYRPAKTLYQLTDEFQSNQIKIEPPLILGTLNNQTNGINKDINHLADYWINSSSPMSYMDLKTYKEENYGNIEIWATENTQTEIMHIATKIKKLVASGKYRYRDIQIMTRELDHYQLSIDSVFNLNDIPYFIDQAESMAEHPILEFITSLFALKKRHYRLDDIMRFLRTELYCPDTLNEIAERGEFKELEHKNSLYEEIIHSWRNKVDVTENVALAYGYRGNDWVNAENWHYARFDLEGEYSQNEQELEIQSTANEVKSTFREQVVPFIDKLEEHKTNREIATYLYQFMVGIGVVDQIEHWRDQLTANGQLEEARDHEQAWDTFLTLLDEFVEVLGDEQWDIDLFISIMETGFEQATFSMVPPTIDQVLITNYDLPKIETKKIVFIIGLTDSQFPKSPISQSLLTDEDRNRVDANLSSDKYLASSEIESAANEPFMMYLAILQATERIFFTYPLSNNESKENRISPYLSRIIETLSIPQQMKYANALSKKDSSVEDYLDFIGSTAQTFGQMVLSLRHALDERKQPEAFWVKVFEHLYQPNNLQQRQIVRSLSHKNIPVPLTDSLAKELYGKDLYLSVSQLETFYSDPYSHFLIYGLRLKERQVQELSPLETGNFFHDALDYVMTEIFNVKKDIKELSEGNIQKITRDIVEMLVQSNKYRLSQSSYRMNFIFKQLSRTVERMIWSVVNQTKRSQLRPSKTELQFGPLGSTKGVKGLMFPLKTGGQLHLRGKVDRIDTVKVNNKLYTSIVDYKSSPTKFDYQKMYHGLMMQMITYLDTVLSNSEEIFNQPAQALGAFYSRVHQPFIDIQKMGNNTLEEELLKSYKFDGLIVSREELLDALDTGLESGYSPLYPFHLSVKGSYTGKNLLTEKEFELLLRFNRDKIIEAGNRILSGENMLRPFDDVSLYTPTVRGSFQAISQFDALLPENNYKEMVALEKDDFFNLLREQYHLNAKEEN